MEYLFSQNTIDFLFENRIQDSRTWYQEHKEDYQNYVLNPAISLVKALTPALEAIDPQIVCSPKVDGSISRIWRDSRFSKDKSLFRDIVWCSFVRQKNVMLPEFFFLFSADGFFYGCGYYATSTASMMTMREMILTGSESFQKAFAAYENQNEFIIEGDRYKKSRHPDAPENLKTWLDRKNISFIKRSGDFELLFSEQIVSELADGFKALAPMYRFMIQAEERTRCE